MYLVHGQEVKRVKASHFGREIGTDTHGRTKGGRRLQVNVSHICLSYRY